MKDSGGIERKPLVGLITLLVIFAALCLTILSILSFSTAKYEKNLAQKNADAAAAYYKADSWCTDAANSLYSVWRSGGDLSAEAAKYGGKCETEDGESTINYVCQVDDARLLAVTIRAGDDFTVAAWQTVPKNSWTVDEHIHVWNMTDAQEYSQQQG
jgi:glutathione S-transferase